MEQSTFLPYQMLPRTVMRSTPLVEQGQCVVTILYPGSDHAYRELAESLAQAVEQVTACRPEIQADTAVMPLVRSLLPERYRQRSLILLGNLNTNRALLPLYARYYCATDATYPGGDGYDLRTIVNPYGTGFNVILAGGSTLRGVERAIERLITHVADSRGGSLPFLLEVDLSADLARLFAEWPDTPLGVAIPTMEDSIRKTHALTEGIMKAIGGYGIMYAWTGDARYGLFARDCLKALNAQMGDSYGDWHYRAERVLRALPWLCAGGFLDEAEILRTDQWLLGTALGTQHMWWRLRDGNPPLGHRHHGRGTYEFLLLARYLKEQARPNDAVRLLCNRWIDESCQYLDALGQAGIDDQDDESTLTNLATVFWYALGEERFEFFENGSARRVAERAIALHDNMGAGAGQGGYGEGLPGTMYLQQEATVPVAACTFYFQDSHLKWILEHLPHLKSPQISGFLQFSPFFMHMFHTGPELAVTPPDDLGGLRVLPITPHQFALSNHPPEHIENLGHSVNAPETWLRAEGIGLNTLPRERGFDKIVLRGGFAPTDAYLLLQGYQGGYRWQGHNQAANCIVRFSQAGHIFLIQNTNRHSQYHKNGLFISDGYNDTPLPPIAERVAVGDFAHVGLSATRLSDYHHADWTRHLFWSKRGAGYFVVIDAVIPQADGPYALTCTWRTPGYAWLAERAWQANQGDDRFTLRWSESLNASSQEETHQGAANPYVLRQFRDGEFKSSESITFQNLFYVRSQAEADQFDIVRLEPGQALVTQDGVAAAWCGISGPDGKIKGPGLAADAINTWVNDDEIALSATTSLAVKGAGGWKFESARPIGLYLDLAAAQATASLDSPGDQPCTLQVNLGDAPVDFVVDSSGPVQFDLPAVTCQEIAAALRKELQALRPHKGGDESSTVSPEPLTHQWHSAWAFDGWTLLPERIRNLTVQALPPPVDAFAEQLIDTVTAEIRQTRQQWPTAEHYEITLNLPAETPIDHLRIVGDSKIEPTLRTFHPLPADISVSVSNDHFRQDNRTCPADREPGLLRYKLYRDVEDHLETRQVAIDQTARQIRVRVPAPEGRQPLVLHEVEVYGARRVRPAVEHLLTATLDGQPAILIVYSANELILLSEDGTERWRQRLPGPVTHVSCHDLDGAGQQSICLGLLGGELRILSADGSLRQSIPLAQNFQQRRDALFGRVNTIHDLQVWHREPDGRAALVAGGYSLICFLDPEYNIIGHSWADGSWQNNILIAPDSPDLWVRSGWNHGVGVYEGKPGLAPSRETISFGGVDQPMYRALRKVIPFVNGETIAFEWLAGDERILAAAENGVGVLSITNREWLWKIEGGTPITACIAAGDEIVVGGADGFIAAFAISEGQPLRRLRTGAPVVGLCTLPGDFLAVATRKGLFILEPDWRVRDFLPVGVRRLCRVKDGNLLIVRDDGALELLVYEGMRAGERHVNG